MADVSPNLPRDFELPDHTGRPWRFAEALGESAIVLLFNRGDW